MVKYQIVNVFNSAQALTTGNRHVPFGNCISKNIMFTESEAYNKIHRAFTLEKVQVRVTANSKSSGDSSLIFRVNGSDTSSVTTIPPGMTGVFENEIPVSVAADSTCNWRCTFGSGSGSVSFDYLNYIVDFSGSTYTSMFCNASAVNNIGVSSPRYTSLLGGNLNSTTEPLTQVSITSGTLKGQSANEISERDGDSSSIIRKDGNDTSNGLLLNNLQYFENYTDQVSYSNELINYKMVIGGSTGNLRLSTQCCEIEATKAYILGENSNNLSMGVNPFYYFIGGNLGLNSTDDSGSRLEILGDNQKCTQIKCNISSNTVTDNSMSIELQKNGTGTGLILTIPTSTTGQFEYSSTDASFSAGDEVNYKIYGNGSISSGNLLIRNIISAWETTTPPAPSDKKYLGFFKLVGAF